MTIKTFHELYVAELQEARSLEEMLTKALPKMADAAKSERLKTAFGQHLEETRGHLEQVEALLRGLNEEKAAHADQSMERLIQEADRMAGMVEAGAVRDAALIASAQRIEHYEIAVYGTLSSYADVLQRTEDREILAAILEEEEDCDDLLTDIAEGMVNPSAIEAAE
ncbi:ferritin-like domain-containing protein [Lutibaculum baratangense]|uniref:Uncharacterized protein n=1 Tax=Lutibaculum baratangense AMV1 TaxID=631454 RepID=V4RJH8_9HYPH|nr:DUF892 family protein [Lutibaculum baratangense]ESR23390.1 protein of unknown function DUF892 [Lutibaculum baratangense AMV1]